VLGGAVPDLRLRADRWYLRAAFHVLASSVHLLYFTRRKYFKHQTSNIKTSRAEGFRQP
jgi:hypothetical protein